MVVAPKNVPLEKTSNLSCVCLIFLLPHIYTIFLFSFGKTFFFFFTSQHLSKPHRFSLSCTLQKLCRKKLMTLFFLLVLSLERKYIYIYFFLMFWFHSQFYVFFSSPNWEDPWDKALRLIHIT